MYRPVLLFTMLGALAFTPQEPPAPVPLILIGAIPLPRVQGRIDHFALDRIHSRMFVSALGANSEEVVSLSAQALIHTISGIPAPQGVVYSPETDKVFVGSDQGKLTIYNGSTYALIRTLDFGDDVDNLRYDAAEKRVYVGYGNEKTGAIAMVDAVRNQRLPEEFKLGAHPESFQLAASTPDLYVNLPDLNQIAAIDRNTHAVTRWHIASGGNFPMALDESNHRLFVCTRSPARLLVLDTSTGRLVTELPAVQDADDLYYDAARKRLYVPGGEGALDIFEQSTANRYTLKAKLTTALGARTAGYFGKGNKGFDRLYLAVPARDGHQAEVRIYSLQD